MMLKARTMLNARLATSTAPAMGRPTRRSWTPAPPVHFAGLDERLARPAAGATYPRDNSEFDEVPERPKMLMLTIMACRNLASLHKVVSDRSQDFDHTHVSASVEKVFELSGTFTDSETDLPQQLMKELGEAAEGCLMNMSGTAVARVLWAFRKVGGTPNSSLVRDIVARTGQTFRNGSSFDILRALAELRVIDDGTIAGLANIFQYDRYCNQGLYNLKPKELSHTLWAVATIGIGKNEFNTPWQNVATPKLHEFDAAALEETLWAAAKLRMNDQAFTSKWVDAALTKLDDFDHANLRGIFEDATKLGISDTALFAKWLDLATPKLGDFSGLDLSDTLWTVAMLGIRDEAFITKWVAVATPKLPDMSAQALSNTLWAASVLGIEDEAFTTKWVDVARPKLDELSAPAREKAIWAATNLGIHDDLCATVRP